MTGNPSPIDTNTGPKPHGKHSAPRWVIKLFERLIIPAVFAFVGIYWSFFAVGPRVTVYYAYDEGYYTLPSKSRNLLLFLSELHERARLRPPITSLPKEDIARMRNAIANISPIVAGTSNTDLFDDWVKLLTDLSDYAPDIYHRQVVRLVVINSGNRTAKEISLIPQSAGAYEIWPEGNPTDPETYGYTQTKFVIPTLQPGERKLVTLWLDNSSDEFYPPVTASYADGPVNGEPYTISRDGSSFIFSIPRSALIIIASMAAAVVVIFIFHRVFGHSSDT